MASKNETSELEKDRLHCSPIWDRDFYWKSTAAGSIVSQYCDTKFDVCNNDRKYRLSYNATKLCFTNGTWDVTDNSQCHGDTDVHRVDIMPEFLPGTRPIVCTGKTISIITLAFSIWIFFHFRSLHCLRNYIHCNHFLAHILDSFSWIWLVTKAGEGYDETYSDIVIPISIYSHSTIFYWMTAQGFFVAKRTTWKCCQHRKDKLWHYLFFGWGIPVFPIALVQAVHLRNSIDKKFSCPEYKLEKYRSPYINIILFSIPTVLLIVNAVFLVQIFGGLISKCRSASLFEARLLRRAAKGTVGLFPLLGLHYLLDVLFTLERIRVQTMFSYTYIIFTSFEGVLFAVIYCFSNDEVLEEIRRRFKTAQDKRTITPSNSRVSHRAFSRSSSGQRSVFRGFNQDMRFILDKHNDMHVVPQSPEMDEYGTAV